ncbi:MAG: phage portal protein [Selenomonadaceae bacterium]|nr:phage portal protein [Selenomonadaceae bacterium]
MSGYSEGAASTTKKTIRNWNPRHFSPRFDIDEHIDRLRNRANDLVLNDAVGSAIISTLTTGTIGSGLKLFPRIKADELGMTQDAARLWSRKVKREFNLWANNQNACDFLRRNNFFELQAVAFRAMLYDGDCFVLFKRRAPEKLMPYSLRIQLVDAQRVSNPATGIGNQVEMLLNNNRIVRGIEVDKSGSLVAIHVANRIWNEPSLINPVIQWQRVLWHGRLSGSPNLLHLCKDQSPDQFRGVPVIAPVIEALKQLSRYSDAELSASIIRSFFAIFFTQPNTNWSLNEIADDAVDDTAKEFKIGSPSVTSLPRGLDVKSIDSSNSQSTFAEYTAAFLKNICAAIGLPAEVVLKTFNASYSASRAALLQAEDEFKARRAAFVNDFCKPVYEQFLTEAIALGRIDAPGFFDDPIRHQAYLNADWLSQKNNVLDPAKEVQAAILRINNGLSTKEIEVANLSGRDYDDIKDNIRSDYNDTV